MTTFTVYKGSKDGSIQKSQTAKPSLQDDEVLLRVTASGLCGTDEHYRKQDMVLGHEGAGVVEDFGSKVQQFKKGDRVGWGYQHGSCGHCDFCQTGREHFCEQRTMYGNANFDQGSFATKAVWKEAYLFKIPDGLTDAEAAPLMCGGATVFQVLHSYGIKSTDRIGVMGVGGLGHLAIQFASKMGIEVVVFSGTDSKREEAMQLGATEFVVLKDKKDLDIGKKLNALLVTTSFMPDWNVILPTLAPDSVIFPLTVSPNDFSFPSLPMIVQGIRIQGSVIAPRAVHKRMLAFSAHHQIKPIIQEFPMSQEGITDAMETLSNGKMRYRGVLIPGK